MLSIVIVCVLNENQMLLELSQIEVASISTSPNSASSPPIQPLTFLKVFTPNAMAIPRTERSTERWMFGFFPLPIR